MTDRDPPIPVFLLVLPPNLQFPRRRSRQALSRNATIRFFFYEESLAAREAAMVTRFEYVLWSLTVTAVRSAIFSTVLSVLRLRAFVEG